MIDIRTIGSEQELMQARALLEPGAVEPNWDAAFVVMEGGEVAGLLVPAVRLIAGNVALFVEPLHMRRLSATALIVLGWTDGLMRCLCAANGLTGYFFQVDNTNRRFQRFVERHLPVVGADGDTAKSYYRKF